MRFFPRFLFLLLALLASFPAYSQTTYGDRFTSSVTSIGVKAPCRVATTANITLSGLQTIDGVTLHEADRVLVKNQTTPSQNGLYNASALGWQRTFDFNGPREAVNGTIILVNEGTAGANTAWKVAATDPVNIGTDSISFNGAYITIPTGLALPSITTAGFAHIGGDLTVAGNTTFSGALTLGATTITAAANNSAISASYSLTGSSTNVGFLLTGTWNTSGQAVGIEFNATDTASASNSLLLDLLTNGTPQFYVTKTGITSQTGDAGIGGGLSVGANTVLTGTLNVGGTTTAAAINASSINFGGSSLSHYDQGTWTPTLDFGGTTTGITYSTQSGTFTRIGNIMFITGQISLSSKGSATGNAHIGGLPTASNGSAYMSNIWYSGMSSITPNIIGLINNGNPTSFDLMECSATTCNTGVTNSNFGNSTVIAFTGFYKL